GLPPVFASATTASAKATNPFSFTVAATGTPTPTFIALGLPSWASFNAATGVISGTPPDTVGSPFNVTVTATNGITTTQTLTITVEPAVLPPTITAQPSSAAVDAGQSVTFSVTASGTAPLTYQWRRNGAALSGATASTLTIPNAQPANAGTYTVTVANSVAVVISNGATLVVNT